MLYWIYDYSTWTLVLLSIVVLVGYTWAGTLFLRPFLRLFLGRRQSSNDVVGYLLGAHGVYFGILLGLLAVATYQNYTQDDAIVAQEAARLAALYRDVSSYPEPIRSELQDLLRKYTRHIIDKCWKQQQRGQIPSDGNVIVNQFQDKLTQFEPRTKGQEILHAEALRMFNSYIEARRQRLNAVTCGIPAILWYVVFIGAAVNILLIWLLDMKLTAHLFLGAVSSFFLATLIALVAAMDNPFRGEVSIQADAFELVYEQLMAPKPTTGTNGTAGPNGATAP
jgi:hypothetical protein